MEVIQDERNRIFDAPITVNLTDAHGERMNVDSVKELIPTLMMREGIITLEHTDHPIGKLLYAYPDPSNENRLIGKAQLFNTYQSDDEVWKSIPEYGFSVRGLGDKENRKITMKELYSIALTKKPAIGEKVIAHSIAKSEGDTQTTTHGAYNPVYSEKEDYSKLHEMAKAAQENNPWAVCTAALGTQTGEKFERCVMHLKEKMGISKGVEMENKQEKAPVAEVKKEVTPIQPPAPAPAEEPKIDDEKDDQVLDAVMALNEKMDKLLATLGAVEIEKAKVAKAETKVDEVTKSVEELKKSVESIAKSDKLPEGYVAVEKSARPQVNEAKSASPKEIENVYKAFGYNR